MNPYDRYCMENDVKPRKGEYMDIGIAVTYDTPRTRREFAISEGIDFIGFVLANYPDAIDNYIAEFSLDYEAFLEEQNRA